MTLKKLLIYWNKIKRYFILIISLVACISLLTFFRSKGMIETNIFLITCGTTITIFISIINYFQSNDKFFKELFTEFNKRYDSMNSFLHQVKEIAPLTEEDKQRVIDYLNLCAEEYMWVKKGRLPIDIWNSWKNGIMLHLEKESIRNIFLEEQRLWRSSYYGFFDELPSSLWEKSDKSKSPA